ncbi:hypothetical protein [Jiella sp. M17.18]|uniref:hypothetical protein n=1 Tax=Jiella sp. M17.18 TaxID=3234247 RepID=UPI0034DE4700
MAETRPEHIFQRLEDLGSRIRAAVEALRENGSFTSADDALLEDVRDRERAARDKLAANVREGRLMAAARAEIEMDVDAIVEGLTHWEDRLDRMAMKQP